MDVILARKTRRGGLELHLGKVNSKYQQNFFMLLDALEQNFVMLFDALEQKLCHAFGCIIIPKPTNFVMFTRSEAKGLDRL